MGNDASTRDHLKSWMSWALCCSAWLAARYAQTEIAGWGTGNDVWLYLRYAEDWGRGAAAYVDFHPEYPPGSLPTFLLPLLSHGHDRYERGFALEMGMFDLCAALLVHAWTRRAWPASQAAPALATLGYLACSAALFPVLYTRFDLVPGMLLFAALYATYAPGGAFVGALLLGIAAGVKLWPLALFPLWFLLALRRGGFVAALQTSVGVVAGALLTALPVLPRASTHVLDFLRYHAARGIQIESTWSTLALILNALHVAPAHAVHEYGAFHVAGPVAGWFSRLSIPALVLLALVPQGIAFFRGLGREEDAQGRLGLYAAAGGVLGFMIGGKVLSPQYMLWVAPFLPALIASAGTPLRRAVLACMALAVTALTSLVYPYWSPALEQREPGHVAALIAVGSRNLLLIALYALVLRALLRRRIVIADMPLSAGESSDEHEARAQVAHNSAGP